MVGSGGSGEVAGGGSPGPAASGQRPLVSPGEGVGVGVGGWVREKARGCAFGGLFPLGRVLSSR